MSLEEERSKVKKEFEKKRSEVLAALPETYKSLFGRVGFAKTNYGNEWLPCLFLGPYDVPPTSPMRQLWMEMFDKLETKEEMPVLVYWYGSTDASNAHSIVPYSCVQALIVRKHAVKLPKNIQQKLSFGRTDLFTRKEQGVYRAYYALVQDITRGTRQMPFQEFYQDDNYVLSARALEGRTDRVIERSDASVASSGAPSPPKRTSQSETSIGDESSATKRPRLSNVYDVTTTVGQPDCTPMETDSTVTSIPTQQQSETKKPASSSQTGTDNTSQPNATVFASGDSSGLTQQYHAYQQKHPPQQHTSRVPPPPPPPPSSAATHSSPATATARSITTADTTSDDEMMQQVADVFVSSMKPIKECQGQIKRLSEDESLNHEETIEATIFWQRMLQKWKDLLPFYNRESCPTETLLKNVDRFMAAITVIKDCQEQIKVLATDMSRTRVEIAQETLLWRNQEAEWKKRLPFYDNCSM